jgi:spore maturation protein SpmA
MLNYIWLALLLLSVLFGGWNGHLKEVTDGAFDGAKTAVMTIALPLVGAMAIWLGIMRLAEKSGLIVILARALRPIMRRLFPDVPPDHPAMGAMVMNMAANMLGLGNAATPLGLRAMNDLEKLNPHPGTATNAMCTFLAVNTSSVQLIPATAIAILAAKGAANPTAIVGTSLFATSCAAIAGITAAKLLEKLPIFAAPRVVVPPPSLEKEAAKIGPEAAASTAPAAPAKESPALPEQPIVAPLSIWGGVALALFMAAGAVIFFKAFFLPLPTGAAANVGAVMDFFLHLVNAVSLVALPLILAFFPLYAAARGIKVYEEFVEGAKEGFQVALRIIPFLVAMLTAIFMFRGSGGLKLLTDALRGPLALVGFPADLLPLTLMRPLSGSASLALFSDLVAHFGPDHLITRMAGTIFGSTETTFYVIAVYFGSVAVRRTRHAIAAGLIADTVGVIASVAICRLLFI